MKEAKFSAFGRRHRGLKTNATEAFAVAVGRTTTTTLVAAMLRAMGDHERSSAALPNKGGEKKSGKKDFQRSFVRSRGDMEVVCVCVWAREEVGKKWGAKK